MHEGGGSTIPPSQIYSIKNQVSSGFTINLYRTITLPVTLGEIVERGLGQDPDWGRIRILLPSRNRKKNLCPAKQVPPLMARPLRPCPLLELNGHRNFFSLWKVQSYFFLNGHVFSGGTFFCGFPLHHEHLYLFRGEDSLWTCLSFSHSQV